MNSRLQQILDRYEKTTNQKIDKLKYTVDSVVDSRPSVPNTLLVLKNSFGVGGAIYINLNRVTVDSQSPIEINLGTDTMLHQSIGKINTAMNISLIESDVVNIPIHLGSVVIDINNDSLQYVGMLHLNFN